MSETYTFRSIFSKPISYAKDEDPIVISKVIIPRIQRPMRKEDLVKQKQR